MFKRVMKYGAVAVAALSVALAGASAQNVIGGKKTQKSFVIGVIAKSQSNPVFIAARTGAEDAAKELGKKYGVEIKIDWRTPTGEDAQKQSEFLEQLVAAGADGVAISVSDAKVCEAAINGAVDKGVAVATFDSDAPKSKRFAYFGIDDVECGRQVARELAKAMGGKGTVAILAGNQNAPNLQARVRGVKEELAKDKDIKILDTYYHAETAQDAVAKVEQVQGANPQITGWAMVGGWPLFTENALDKVAGKAKVVAVDALKPELAYLQNGQVEVLLAQQVYEWGYESVRLIMEKLIENKTPSNPIVTAKLIPIRKADAEAYGKNWDKWLGKK
jgi:ribose transport system substrate-binding protein